MHDFWGMPRFTKQDTSADVISRFLISSILIYSTDCLNRQMNVAWLVRLKTFLPIIKYLPHKAAQLFPPLE